MGNIRKERPEITHGTSYSKYHEIFYDPFTEERNEEAWETLTFCLESGYTDLQLATFLGVSLSSIGGWKREFPEFLKAMKSGKKISDDAVERALFERAVGLDIVETKVQIKDGEATLVDIITHVPGDVKAQLNWLYNRAPDRWRQVVHNTNENVNKNVDAFDTSKLTDEELEQYLKLLQRMS